MVLQLQGTTFEYVDQDVSPGIPNVYWLFQVRKEA
jgi:hypothetical protein